MLIDSPRLLPQDRAEWERRRRYDRAHAGRLGAMPDQARAAVEEWATGRDEVIVAVSWGKDSVAVADLALTSAAAPRIRLVWVRQRWYENPDSLAVRDAFLARYPGVRYDERTVTTPVPRRWDWPDDDRSLYRPPGPRATGSVWPTDRVTGIRADESDARRVSAHVHGQATDRTCRPILSWRQEQVFGYLAARNLPVHPVYAMTTFGGLDRPQLRVHSLGGMPGLRHRGPWEDAYYGEVIRADRVAIAVLRCLPASQGRRTATPVLHAKVSALVEGVAPGEVGAALQRLHREGLVARWERYGREGWWRWADRPVALPGLHLVGDCSVDAAGGRGGRR